MSFMQGIKMEKYMLLTSRLFKRFWIIVGYTVYLFVCSSVWGIDGHFSDEQNYVNHVVQPQDCYIWPGNLQFSTLPLFFERCTTLYQMINQQRCLFVCMCLNIGWMWGYFCGMPLCWRFSNCTFHQWYNRTLAI